jgi:hypothetical protein
MLSEASTRLVQLIHPEEGRRVALVDRDHLRLLATNRSAYSFAKTAIELGWKLRDLLSTDLSGIVLDYEATYQLSTPWRFLASFDHSDEPSRCLVSAAGASASEWSYLGLGTTLRGHGDPVPIPEEQTIAPPIGDIAALYIISPDGAPRRVGVTTASAFCGPGFPVRSNVLGPELILDPAVASVEGSVTVYRNDIRLWSQTLSSKGAPLLYALAAAEPDHFRYADHHRPGDAHVHFIGARLFGGRENATLQDGDRCEASWEGLGKPLVHSIQMDRFEEQRLVASPL